MKNKHLIIIIVLLLVISIVESIVIYFNIKNRDIVIIHDINDVIDNVDESKIERYENIKSWNNEIIEYLK